MKTKIPIKNLRYVVPCLLLPFLTFTNWVVQDSVKSKPSEEKKEVVGINAQLQDPDLEKTQTMNKFDALFEAYNQKEDFSAIKGIEEEDKNLELDDKDLYSMSEMDKISQMGKMGELAFHGDKTMSNYAQFKNKAVVMENSAYQNYPNYGTASTTRYANYNRPSNDYEQYMNSIKANAASTELTPSVNPLKQAPKSRFDEEMALFKAQMSIIDSITNKDKPNNPTPKTVKTEPTIPNPQPVITDTKEVRKAGLNGAAHFNTLGDSRKNGFIKAILDEGLKVYDGSRVRIRVLDDIVVDNTPLSKGSYLFGIINGFATQRVFITIQNIVYDSRIINVNLDVYDYDGMRGLYIPESLFREISKDAGAQAIGQNISFSSGTDINATQLAYQAAQDAYRASTRAMSDAIRKRKAILKYNTMVYLVNKNEKE